MIGGVSLYGWIYIVGLLLLCAYFLYWMFKINKNKKLTAVFAGTLSGILLFLIFGMVSAIIKNPVFTRMTPFGSFEVFSLAMTSLLLGVYIGLAHYGMAAKKDNVCNTSATTGGVFGFLTFGCSVCNKILVFLLGFTGVLIYFEPIRPYLIAVSTAFFLYAIVLKWKANTQS